MNKFLTVMAFLVLSLSIASATPICTIANSPVVGLVNTTSVTCDDGLIFDNFSILSTTGTPVGWPGVDITAAGGCNGTEVCLDFNPSMAANEDVTLLFEVWGGITSIDMSVGGRDATIDEKACANYNAANLALFGQCANAAGTSSVAPLSEITVASGDVGQPIIGIPPTFPSTNPVWIYKDIGTGAGISGHRGELSAFAESFQPNVPEPVSMVLLGSGLLGLGLLRRRSRKSKN